MIEVVAIGGVPGSGKSTLMLEIIRQLGGLSKAHRFELGVVKGYEFSERRVMILGLYDREGETFPGTDRLSMAVQPVAEGMLAHMKTSRDYDGYRVLFEGDRLTTASFFKALQQRRIPLKFYVLDVSTETQAQRFRQRETNQPATFLKGRASKYKRLLEQFEHTALDNNKDSALSAWAQVILNGVEAK